MSNPRVLIVEAPEASAVVDFLSEGVTVTMTVVNGVLRVVARDSHGENASTWDEHEVEWPLRGGS